MLFITKKEKLKFAVKTLTFNGLVILGCLCFCLCFVFFAIPLIASFLPLFYPRYTSFNSEGIQDVFFMSFRIWKIFTFTLFHSFFSSILAIFVGFVSSFFCANRDFIGRKFFLSLSGIPLTIPALIIALAYMLFFGNNGFIFIIIRKLFNFEGKSFLYSTFGIILIQGFYNFPIAMQFISESWQKIPSSEIESAILLGANKKIIFKTITLPYLLPSIISSFFLIFLFCFFSFVIVLLFAKVGTSTVEVELYKCICYTFNIVMAAKISVLELSFATILLIFHSYFKEKGRCLKVEFARKKAKIQNGVEKCIFAILIFFITFFLFFPIFSIFIYSFYSQQYSYSKMYSFSFRAWKNIFSSKLFWESLFNSIYVACSSVCISIFASIFFCYLKVFYMDRKKIDILPFLPLVVSSIMLGFGYSLILKRGNVLILILTQSSMFYLHVYSQMKLSIMRIPYDIISASLLLSNSKILTFFSIVLPLTYKALLSGAIFVFASSIADASLPLVLNIEGYTSLSLLLFNFASSYRLSESATLSIILLSISFIAFYLKEA